MAKPVLGKSLCSDWFFLVQDFAERTVSMETVQSVYFVLERSRQIQNLQPKQRKKKVWILSFFKLKLPKEAEKIEIFPKFQRCMKTTNIFKSKPPEVHFTIRNRVPYNELLTNLAFSSRTAALGPYCHDLGPIFPSTALALR